MNRYTLNTVNFTAENTIELLHCGSEFFPALLRQINAACTEIYLETYIFSGDETADTIKEGLIRAAARGVMVNVMIDWHGTGRLQVAVLSKVFQQAGVNCRAFNPWFRRGVVRSHRKICVVDKSVAFVGGINITDDWRCDFDPELTLPAPRWDFSVQISGPLVANVHQEVRVQWARLGKLDLLSRFDLYRKMRSNHDIVTGAPALAGLVVRDNLRNRTTIQNAYLRAMHYAKKSILLANPYFAPNWKLRNALVVAAARGVDVTLLIGVGQFGLQDAVTHAFYPSLLKSGVKLVEYRKTQLHAKVAVVDDEWATVGSSNYDGLSLFINQEANIVIQDAEFSQTLRLRMQQGMADGVQVRLEDYARIPRYKRMWYGMVYVVYRSLMWVVTLGNYV